jgi:Tol biopolymer transport system component
VTDSSKADFWGWWPEWSPDGAHLTLLDGNESSSGWVIKRIDLGSGEITVLGDARGNRSAPWSPDGQLLIYGTGDLWTMSPDGSASHLLLRDDMYNYNAAWTPARKVP